METICLQQALQKRNILLEEYADIIGVTIPTLNSRLEGKTEFTYMEMLKTKEYFSLDPIEFIVIFNL